MAQQVNPHTQTKLLHTLEGTHFYLVPKQSTVVRLSSPKPPQPWHLVAGTRHKGSHISNTKLFGTPSSSSGTRSRVIGTVRGLIGARSRVIVGTVEGLIGACSLFR